MVLDWIAKQLGVAELRTAVATIVPRYFESSGTMFFTLGCQLLWFVILARSLGVAHFGELMVISGVTTMAAAICTLGSREAIVRRTSRDSADYAAMLGQGLILISTLGIALVILCVFFLKLFIVDASSVSVISLVLFCVVQILIFPFVGLATASFMGFENFRLANIITAGAGLIRLLAASTACLVFNVNNLDDWALWTTGANLILALACMLLLRRLVPPVWRIDAKELTLGFHFSTPIVVYALRSNIDRIVLGMVASPSVIGAYAVAMRLTFLSKTVVVNALNRIMYPKFVKRMRRGKGGSLRIAVSYTIVLMGLSTTTACCLYLTAPYLPVLLGEEYREVIFDLRVVCWLLIPMSMTSVPYDLLGAVDHHRLRSKYHNRISFLGAVVSAIVIYIFGIRGAFVSFYIVEISLLAGMWAVFINVLTQAGRDAAVSASGSQPLEKTFVFIANAFRK